MFTKIVLILVLSVVPMQQEHDTCPVVVDTTEVCDFPVKEGDGWYWECESISGNTERFGPFPTYRRARAHQQMCVVRLHTPVEEE